MVKLLTTPPFGFLVVLALSLFLLMNEQSSSLILVFVVSLVMVCLKKGFRCYDPISHRLRVSRHVEFWEYRSFTSLQQYPASHSSESPIFTDLFLPLYHELMKDSSTSAASPDYSSPVLSPAYNPPVLDSMAPPSPESPVGPKLRCSTRVIIPPPYLTDYHYSFAFATLYEPHTYREAHTDPFWQQAMNEEQDALHKNNTWDMIDLPLGQFVVGCRWVRSRPRLMDLLNDTRLA